MEQLHNIQPVHECSWYWSWSLVACIIYGAFTLITNIPGEGAPFSPFLFLFLFRQPWRPLLSAIAKLPLSRICGTCLPVFVGLSIEINFRQSPTGFAACESEQMRCGHARQRSGGRRCGTQSSAGCAGGGDRGGGPRAGLLQPLPGPGGAA